MLVLVSGGAASGKSEFAESLIVRAGHAKRTYIATMELRDAEDMRRAARHRAMRAGKGFITLECPRGLIEAPLPQEGGSALLECMSNLVADVWRLRRRWARGKRLRGRIAPNGAV